MSQPQPPNDRRGCVGFLLGVAATLLFLYFRGTLDPQRPAPREKPWGEFLSNPKAEWLLDGRDMRLTEDFVYVDSRKKAWVAPAGSIVNGASIPKLFWSVIGGPFEGKYRNASVVHDTECERKGEPSAAVHYMFYEACLCGGADEHTAKVMYWAVYHFGPSWAFAVQAVPKKVKLSDGRVVEVIDTTPSPVDVKKASNPPEDVKKRAEEIIRAKNLSIEEIQKLTPEDLKVGAFPK